MKKRGIFSTIIIVFMLGVLIVVYRKYDFNFYSKGVTEFGKTNFLRDGNETSDGKRSYKIENTDYTSSMFYRKITVTPNSAYKVSCMIKTKDVEQYNDSAIAGAQIVLKNTEEHSNVIAGTTDWTKVEFCFNSKNNSEVEIGFALGENTEKAKGTAWFSDIKIEQGYKSDDNKWEFACFIFKNTAVNLNNGINVNETMKDRELMSMDNAIRKFQDTIENLSKSKIHINCTIIRIEEPITTLTYDEYNGYYVSEKDVYRIINNYLVEDKYDHIFACFKLPDEADMNVQNVTNWIGLGNMMYCGKGFSNIRIPEKEAYEYSIYNNFQQEVLLHEFLHTLERNSIDFGYEIPALHDNEKYGYKDDSVNRLKTWYSDYMNKEIKTADGSYIGLPENIFRNKPIKVGDFKYANELNYLDEPKNLIEIVNCIIAQIKNLFNREEQEITIQIVSN